MPRTRSLRRSVLTSCSTLVVATTLASPAFAGDCIADLDGDGRVGGSDLGLLLVGWSSPGPSDLDGDGTTGGSDLGIMLVDWGCEVSEPPTTPPLRLRASETLLETGVPTDIRFDVPVPALIRETATSIALFEVDATGTPVGEALATLEDDPYDDPWDSVYVDGVYTAFVTFDEPVDRTFQIAAIADLGDTAVASQAVTFQALTTPSTDALEAEVHIYDAAIEIWEEKVAEFGRTEEAREATRTALLADPVVVEVLLPDSIIEVHLASGLSFLIATPLNDKLGDREGRFAGEPSRKVGRRFSADAALGNVADVADNARPRTTAGSTDCDDCTRIKNNKVLIWDPEGWYADCWQNEELDAVWTNCFDLTVLSGTACTRASLDTFSDYGTVVCLSHGGIALGDTFWLTTGEEYSSFWGPSLPQRQAGQVTPMMITRHASVEKKCSFLDHPDSFKAKVLAVSASYLTSRQIDLSDTVIFLAACKSGKPATLSMLDEFTTTLGACAAVGLSEDTFISWYPTPLRTFFLSLVDGATIDEAFDGIDHLNDGNSPASKPRIRVRNEPATDLTYDGTTDLAEGGFEFCGVASEAWTFSEESFLSGAYEVFLANTPTEGDFMGVVSAGEGNGWFEGATRQSFCPSVEYDRLVFDWKLVWTAYKIWDPPFECNPKGAMVSVVLTDAQGNSEEVFATDAGLECGNFLVEGSTSEGGVIVGTPWLREEVDVSAFFAGFDSESGAVTIEFKITEFSGASSVFLIDAVEFIDDTP